MNDNLDIPPVEEVPMVNVAILECFSEHLDKLCAAENECEQWLYESKRTDFIENLIIEAWNKSTSSPYKIKFPSEPHVRGWITRRQNRRKRLKPTK